MFEYAIEMLKPNKNDRLQIYENPMKMVVKNHVKRKNLFFNSHSPYRIATIIINQ